MSKTRCGLSHCHFEFEIFLTDNRGFCDLVHWIYLEFGAYDLVLFTEKNPPAYRGGRILMVYKCASCFPYRRQFKTRPF